MTEGHTAKTVEKFQIGDKANRSDINPGEKSKTPAFFPNRSESKTIAYKSLLFPIKNWKFCLLAGLMYFLIAWILNSKAHSLFGLGLIEKISGLDGFVNSTVANLLLSFEVLCWSFILTLKLCVSSPGIALLLLAIFAGLFAYADPGRLGVKRINTPSPNKISDKNKTSALITRGVLCLAHFIMLFVSFVFVLFFTVKLLVTINASGFVLYPLFMVCMIILGGFCGGLVMGIYLLLSNKLFGAHSNEVFLCQSIPDYKNFLRLHIDKNGRLTIYSVGVRKVCKDWQLNKSARKGEPWFEPKQQRIDKYASLIEKPVEVKKNKPLSSFQWFR